MKATDYIANRIKRETDTIFGITGGAIINMFDSLYKKKFRIVNMHHEQACAMAADAYARVSGELGVAIATSGPGATNLVTGTCCSWYDSIPVLTIAGQVPTNQLKKHKIRQYGFQETDTVELFRTITKYSKRVNNVFNDLEEAILLAKSGRPGPTFLELCDDIQRSNISGSPTYIKKQPIYEEVKGIEKLVNESKKPLLIIGAGVKQANAEDQVRKMIEYMQIPTFLTWGSMDLLPDNHPLNCRDFGVTSQRIGNYAIQNSDLILAIGARLDTHEVTGNWAPHAKKIIIDIDKEELKKYDLDYKFHSDLKGLEIKVSKQRDKWLSSIQTLRKQFPLPENRAYKFIDELSRCANEGNIIIPDAGQNLTWTMQGWKVKEGQRLFSAFNHSPMGYSLPASIGAQFADPNEKVISIIGDGGLQMNLQELQTIVGYNLPIKIFVIDNNKYGMIKQTQSDWPEHLKYGVACEPHTADLEKITNAHEIKYFELSKDMVEIPQILNTQGPVICKVKISEGTKIEPKLKYGDDFDNLTPHLSKREVKEINKTLK